MISLSNAILTMHEHSGFGKSLVHGAAHSAAHGFGWSLGRNAASMVPKAIIGIILLVVVVIAACYGIKWLVNRAHHAG